MRKRMLIITVAVAAAISGTVAPPLDGPFDHLAARTHH